MFYDGSATIEYNNYAANGISSTTSSVDSKKSEEKSQSSVFNGNENKVVIGDGFERKRKISPEEALDEYIEGYSKMEPSKQKAELKAFLLKIVQQGPEALAKFKVAFKAKTGIDIQMDAPDCDKHSKNPTSSLLRNDMYKKMLETQLLKSEDKKAAFEALKTDEEKAKFIENEFKATLTPEKLAEYEKSPNNDAKTQIITDSIFKNSELFEKMDGVTKNKYLSAKENEKKLIRGEEFYKSCLNEKQLQKYNELTTAKEKEEFIQNEALENKSIGGKISKLFGRQKKFSTLPEKEQIEIISNVLAKCETPEEIEFVLQTRFRGFKLSDGNSNLLTKAIADQKIAQNMMAGFEHMFENPDATDHIKENAITTVYDQNVKEVMGEQGQAYITEVAIDNGSRNVKQFTTNTMAEKGSLDVIKHVTDSVNGGDDLDAKECLANSAHLAKGESERYMFKSSYDTNIESVQKNLAKNVNLYDDENRGDFVNKLGQSEHGSVKNDIANYISEHPEYTNSISKSASISAAAVVAANTEQSNSATPTTVTNSDGAGNSKSMGTLRKAFMEAPTITEKINLAAEMNRPDLIEKIVEFLSDSQKSHLLDKMSLLPNGVKKDILAIIDRSNPSLEMVQKMKKIKSELSNQHATA